MPSNDTSEKRILKERTTGRVLITRDADAHGPGHLPAEHRTQTQYLATRAIPTWLAEAAGVIAIHPRTREAMKERTKLAIAEKVEAIALPYFSLTGEELGWRARQFGDKVEAPDGPPKALAPKGPVAPWVPWKLFDDATWAEDVAVPITFTEAPWKALSLIAAGRIAIGQGGVDAGVHDAAAWRSEGVLTLHEHLRPIAWKGRTVFIAEDAGMGWNPRVALAAAKTARILRDAGARARLVRLPADADILSASRDQGVDDFLAKQGADAYAAMEAVAVSGDPAQRVEELLANEPGWTVERSEEEKRARVEELLPELLFLAQLKVGGRSQVALVAQALKRHGMRIGSTDLRQRVVEFEERLSAKAAEKIANDPAAAYAVENGCLVHERLGVLCWGVPEIVGRSVVDDGTGVPETNFRVHVRLPDGAKFESDVSADALDEGSWITKATQGHLVVETGRGVREQLRHALTARARGVPTTTIHGRLGWLERDGVPAGYLAGDCAVGNDALTVRLGDRRPLKYGLPPVLPPEGVDRVAATAEAILASRSFLKAAPTAITYPLYALLPWSLMVDHLPCRNTVVLIGRSGSRKTALAIVLQAHFGCFRSDQDLPANFVSTMTTIEGVMSVCRSLVVIDDFFPRRDSRSAEKQRALAQEIIRSVGNGQARERSTATLELRASRPPRCVPLMTAEEDPAPTSDGESGSFRTLKLHLSKTDVRNDALTAVQEKLHLLPVATRAFVEHLLADPTWVGRLARLHDDYLQELRELAGSLGLQQRQPETAASMTAAFQLWTEWQDAALRKAGHRGLDVRAEVGALRVMVTQALAVQTEAAVAQVPEAAYLEAIRTVLLGGRAVLLPSTSPLDTAEDRPAIGWYDDEYVYLQPKLAHATVQRLTMEVDGAARAYAGLSLAAIVDAMAEAGWLLGLREKGHLGVKRSLGGGSPRVLVLRREHFADVPLGDTPAAPTGHETTAFDAYPN